MAEFLGGSKGRNDNLGSSKLASTSQRAAGNAGTSRFPAGAAGRALTARGGVFGGTGSPGQGAGGRGGDVGPRPPLRPASAPRERLIGGGSAPLPGSKAGGSPMDARARVEESRQLKEAQYWGREMPVKRELPAFWSISAHGQPFNDERLAQGSTNFYKILEPAGLTNKAADVVGPATQMQASLRKSLETGQRLFRMSDLSPLPAGMPAPRLSDAEREFLISRMTPHQRIHALRNCFDRDVESPDFKPWPLVIVPQYTHDDWMRSRETCMRVALQRVEGWMKHHLKYMSDQECRRARAPAALEKDILQRAFWKVDPSKTGSVSIQQFLQVWQNVLCLSEYTHQFVRDHDGKEQLTLVFAGRRLLDRNVAAALFVKYGFDKDGLLPYVVFMNALTSSPSRLLGHELVLNKSEHGKNGLENDTDIAFCVGGAKIDYRFCKSGVFPPSGFLPEVAQRSRMLPRAHLVLEHVYGYAGMDNLATNLFYTHNTSATNTEAVYYTGCVGVVFNKERWDRGEPCQRFFFGHDNDIQCLTIHPNRKWVATGQQKREGKEKPPYVAIWCVDTCELLQKLDHDPLERSVIAVCFSGNPTAKDPRKRGGDLLVSVTSDDKHTIHVWRWMKGHDAYVKAMYIPGWYYGPDKKLQGLRTDGLMYNPNYHRQRHESDPEAMAEVEQVAQTSMHPLITNVRDVRVKPEAAEGFYTQILPSKDDGTYEQLTSMLGANGTPPMLYGVSWNPLRPQDGRKGSEFLSYGVKHLKSWIVNDRDEWQGTAGSFGNDHIENVLSAIFIPALHEMASPGDSCILTGFASGQLGLWVPPFPTRAGNVYQLTRKVEAHGPGSLVTLNDGSQIYGGVRVIRLKHDGRTVLTGGADGFVMSWELLPPTGARPDGTPFKGTRLRCLSGPDEEFGPNRFKLQGPSAPFEPTAPPMVHALDCHELKPTEFIAGTDGCDIWEVDKDPRVMVEGHEEELDNCDTHPIYANIFATACGSGKVRVWDSKRRDVLVSAHVGFPLVGIAFSREPYPASCVAGWNPPNGIDGFHLAVGGQKSRVCVMDAQTLQPLVHLPDPGTATNGILEANDIIAYSPPGGPGIMAVGSHDLKIYLYRVAKNYQLIARCSGHSGSITHIDWSLPISLPGSKLNERFILQSTDTATDLLYWDSLTGKKIPYNMRDTRWYSWTCTQGFPVMGLWPDDSDPTDINAVSASHLGESRFYPEQAKAEGNLTTATEDATGEESADGIPGCGYIVTADDFSTVKIFNYPAVWDDAPFKAFRGHSSHVTDIKFNCDDRYVISIGGLDRGIYQWRTVGVCLDDHADDMKLLHAMDMAILHRRRGDMTSVPQPLVQWGPLDDTGRQYGPVGKGGGASGSFGAGSKRGSFQGGY